MDADHQPAPGLYLHVPFCAHRCGYCDFNVLTGHDRELRLAYARALMARLATVAEAGPAQVAPPGALSHNAQWPVFGSIFVGGGTPTQLEVAELGRVINTARRVLPIADDAEVSVEANPEDIDRSVAEGLVSAGVTRVSLGVQHSRQHVLDFLDRRHDPETVPLAIAALRDAGVRTINADLIYGAPVETPQEFAEALARVVELGVDGVSAYALILEPNTPYARQVNSGQAPPPDDDVAAERMAAADTVLRAAGFTRDEISNWSKPGHACRHNAATWAGGDYLGVGAAAHSHWRGRRWWERRPTRRWIDDVATGDPVTGSEILTGEQARTERLVLGLRTVVGVPRRAVEPIDESAAARMVAAGLLHDDGDRLMLTDRGLMLADGIAVELLR